ncbi:TPA: hypothetical protein I7181_16095 [Vibrio vulnificus]|nr:hypothetical protein [Vibrio vulnificus]
MPILVHSTTPAQDKNRWGTTWECFEDGQALYGRQFKLDVCAEPATGWWRELVDGKATAIYEPDGRYNFYDIDGVTKKTGVNFPSAFVLWTPHFTHYTPKIPFSRGVADELGINFRMRLGEAA